MRPAPSLVRCPPRGALGERRPNLTTQSTAALPPPPSSRPLRSNRRGDAEWEAGIQTGRRLDPRRPSPAIALGAGTNLGQQRRARGEPQVLLEGVGGAEDRSFVHQLPHA